MRRKFLLLACLSAFAAPPVLAACPPSPIAVIPLMIGGHMLVQAKIDSKPVLMAVDTGAQISSVTPEAATRLQLGSGGGAPMRVQTIGGNKMAQRVVAQTFAFGPSISVDLNLAVLALGDRPFADGVIGADILRFFDFEIDTGQRRLTLYPPEACAPASPPWSPPYQTIAATISKREQILLPVELNGHSLTALFDTGSVTETLSRRAAGEIGVTDAMLAGDPSTTGVSGGALTYAVRRHRFDAVRIGGETYRNITVNVADFSDSDVDLLLGGDYMRGRRFFISYGSHALFVQREAPTASPGGVDHCRPSPEILSQLSHVLPHSISEARDPLPAAVRDQHLDACAGVMFHLSSDGAPIDAKLVAEFPSGSGIGAFVLREIVASRYAPPAAPADWYFAARRYLPSPNPSGAAMSAGAGGH